MEPAIRVRNLTKTFGSVTALNDVSFDVPAGSLFGLLGPNGAGKTTLFGVTAGFLQPTKGAVEMLGVDVSDVTKIHGRFSMLPQDASFQASIPVLEQLVMFARLNGYSEEEAEEKSLEALTLVGLAKAAERKARALSHGMMKRVALCQAFLGEPEVILLDEPTAGLDPENARAIRRLIQAMAGERTVVVSSHNLREIQEICDHAAILHEGDLQVCDTMSALTASDHLVRITLGEPITDEALDALAALSEVESIQRTGEMEFNLQLAIDSPAQKDDALKAVNRCLIGEFDLVPRSVNEGASLEVRFLEITGGTYDGASSS